MNLIQTSTIIVFLLCAGFGLLSAIGCLFNILCLLRCSKKDNFEDSTMRNIFALWAICYFLIAAHCYQAIRLEIETIKVKQMKAELNESLGSDYKLSE